MSFAGLFSWPRTALHEPEDAGRSPYTAIDNLESVRTGGVLKSFFDLFTHEPEQLRMYGFIADGDLNSVKSALQRNPNLLNMRMTAANSTPLIFSLHKRSGGQRRIALWLIENGADLNLQNDLGWTALMTACRYNQPEAAEALIKRRVDINLQNDNGWTALMYACRHNQPNIARILIECGAILDAKNKEGWTALMLACQQPAADSDGTQEGLLSCIKLCYEAGANLDIRRSGGIGALDTARHFNRSDAIEFLEFVTASEGVAKVLSDELGQPRHRVVDFYNASFLQIEDCLNLTDSCLCRMGFNSLPDRRRILERFNSAFVYHAFLTHDWGDDDSNHRLVSSINAMLQDAGIETWFDGERLNGNIPLQIMRGIENSRKVVVFITRRYMEKVGQDSSDYCKDEYQAAVNVLGPENMIPVVVDPEMLDTRTWTGLLQYNLGSLLYIDFTSPAKREANFSFLLQQIRATNQSN
ncbi:Ankyrin repeat and protein kinase domain-containing protein 1 [Hondaea fermentalgiana]|uniref:Ankyrin repeat and protein kinase domain-containing protein 1 n=1 Tax=Hondaea fermentalgiana TaxID=2315210 RepID=A0A2R5GHY1_9STRA|nr:Ankyrin repeat and protein kinase domain-containing protein 1 [Hondaea fermentalgiana]|eukprot:GBG30492.1 Ankyrin repeat and protein kinase domain-containing protein 1 [Hondaea fermentalgiana]